MPSRVPSAEEIIAWDQHHHWHAFTQMQHYQPMVIERAEGSWLIDIHGNRYLDGVSSIWCNLVGHRHPKVDAALRHQLDRLAHCTSLGMGNPVAATLAKRLAEITPGDLQHVFFASDGSCANEIAVKMAFQYWRQCEIPQPQKTKYVALGQAYHGDTLGSSSVGGIARFHALFEPLLFESIHLQSPDPRLAPPGENATKFFLSELENLLKSRHEEIAALILEPLVQGAAGMIMHPEGYLRGVRDLTSKYGVLLIADEVVTGFGRTGKMFACEQEDVVPDILCLGKSISGGYLPLAAAVTHPKIYQAFLGSPESGRAMMHGHTYGGNPLACAAALATLDVLEEEKLLETLPEKAEQLAEILTRIAAHPHVCCIRQNGLIAAAELTATVDGSTPYPGHLQVGYRICRKATERGVWLRPLKDVLVIMPNLAITSEELALLGDVLLQSLDQVTRELAAESGGSGPS